MLIIMLVIIAIRMPIIMMIMIIIMLITIVMLTIIHNNANNNHDNDNKDNNANNNNNADNNNRGACKRPLFRGRSQAPPLRALPYASPRRLGGTPCFRQCLRVSRFRSMLSPGAACERR